MYHVNASGAEYACFWCGKDITAELANPEIYIDVWEPHPHGTG
jgi:hypothetical protein